MSSFVEKEVKCSCGEVFEAEICQSISVGQDPELKDRLLGGQFNVVECPTCKQMVYAEHFVLYHDAKNELMAFVYPRGMESQTEQIRALMGESFQRLQDDTPKDQQIRYQPFLLFGLDALCDLLNIEEEFSDETKVVQALCESMDLAYRKIHFDAARRNNVPALLPLDRPLAKNVKAPVEPESALRGLQKILAANPYLVHYKRFLEGLQGEWFLQESDFV